MMAGFKYVDKSFMFLTQWRQVMQIYASLN